MHFDFDTEIILENPRVLLHPIQEDDFNNLLSVATSDPHLLQYSPKEIFTPELLKEYVETAIQLRKLHSRYTFSVFDKVRNEFAGSTSFLNISNPDARLEIGATWYGKQFQRTGLNRNCKFLLLQFAFENAGAERVELRTDERNTQSRLAIERIGGKLEGILRSHMVMHDGFRRNTVCYSILKPEWEELKMKFPFRNQM